MSMIKLENVSKYYKSEETVSVGMKKINLEFSLGEFVAVTGESGSGKSTLLNVISGLDGYEDGELFLFGEETSHFTIADWEKYRGTYIGFVFQNYNIIDSYTVLQNVLLALEIQGYDPKLRKQRALELIEKVGLTSHKNHKASKLSGGQKQRAVIARALAKDCPVIVADEPTGNLDSASGAQVLELLHDISKGKLVVIVTHDYEQVQQYATRKIKMHDGEVVEDKKIKKAEEVVIKDIPQPAKMTFLTLMKFALRNLVATPRKLIFIMLMQILVVSVFTLVYTNQVSNIREIGLEQSNVYPSVPDTRLLIEKRDGTEFTATELSYFENLRKVNYVYENAMNFYNQNSLNIQSDYQYGNVEGTDTALSLSLKDIDGRLPVAVNEVVISSYYDQFNIGDAFKLTNGYGYYGPEFDSGGQPIDNSLGTFIVVGIDKQERRIIYFSDAYLKTDYPDQILIDSDKYYESYNNIQWSMGFNYLTTSVYLQPAWEPQTEDILIQGDGVPTTLNNQTLTFSSRTSTGSIITQVVTGVSISVPPTFDPEYAVAFMSEAFVAEVMAVFMDMVESEYTITPSNMISLSVDGYYAGNSVIRNVDSTIYKVYYPSNISGFLREFLVFFASLMALVFLSLFGMFLYSIVHAVTRNVMNARKKDFAIFRSIGANKTSLARLVVLEQVMMSTTGFIITIILLRVLSSNVGFIKLSIQYMETKDYVILLTAFMLFGAWLGLRFNKKVFKQSVIETLSASREE